MTNNERTIPRMRTIREAALEQSIPVHALRVLVREDKVVHVKCGNKALVNLDKLIEYLNGERGESNLKEELQ